MRYNFIKDNRSNYSVEKMCQTLEVTRSGFYSWSKRGVNRQMRRDEEDSLKDRICEIYTEHKGMVGSPMITADLRSEKKWKTVGTKRVARLMKQMGIRCRYVKKYVVTTDSSHKEPLAENILNRNFTPDGPNIAWVSDITYLKIGGKWHYLTVFIDLFSRLIVGWDLSDSLERSSVIKAFWKAYWKRKPNTGLIVHSDRGVQYASVDFRAILANVGAIQSMSRKGNCWDNAVAESFFHTIKMQLIFQCKFKTIEEAERNLFQYIEVYYNRKRRHSTNNYVAPAIYEELFWKEKMA